MKPKSKNTKIKVISIITISVLIGAIVVYWAYSSGKLPFLNKNQQAQSNTPNESSGGQADTNTSNSTNNDGTGSSNSDSSSVASPDKPTLIKSSGNNGPVPVNVVIEFVCQGSAGLNCKVVLVNQNGSIVELPSQQVKDNGRGQYFTSWEWRSLSGIWQVYAVVINQQSKSTQSDKQTLEVK